MYLDLLLCVQNSSYSETGDDIILDHAYIWNNVHIASNVEIRQSVVCDKVVVKQGVLLNKQCVLAYDVSVFMFLTKD